MSGRKDLQQFHAQEATYRREMADFWPSGLMLGVIGIGFAARFGPAAGRSVEGAITLAVVGLLWLMGASVWVGLFSRVAREWWQFRREGSGALVLTVDRQGVTLHLLGVRLEWSELDVIRLTTVPLYPQHGMTPRGRQPERRTLLFYERRQEALPDKVNGLARVSRDRKRLGKRNQILYGTPFTVEGARLDQPISQVIQALEGMGRRRVQRLG